MIFVSIRNIPVLQECQGGKVYILNDEYSLSVLALADCFHKEGWGDFLPPCSGTTESEITTAEEAGGRAKLQCHAEVMPIGRGRIWLDRKGFMGLGVQPLFCKTSCSVFFLVFPRFPAGVLHFSLCSLVPYGFSLIYRHKSIRFATSLFEVPCSDWTFCPNLLSDIEWMKNVYIYFMLGFADSIRVFMWYILQVLSLPEKKRERFWLTN